MGGNIFAMAIKFVPPEILWREEGLHQKSAKTLQNLYPLYAIKNVSNPLRLAKRANRNESKRSIGIKIRKPG